MVRELRGERSEAGLRGLYGVQWLRRERSCPERATGRPAVEIEAVWRFNDIEDVASSFE
jgi:hypothetical protein